MVLVSIMTPTWNRFEYEKRAILSVLGQSFENWELLISDASYDYKLSSWLREIGDDRIKYWRTRNRSPHTRRQELFDRSKGSLSCFLDSDDYWEPSRLQEHVHVFERHPWLGLSWDRFKDVGIDQHIRQPFPAGLVEPPRLARHLLGHNNFVHMSSLMASKKALLATGGFPDSWLGDWLMAIRIGMIYPTAYIDKYLSYRDLSAPKRISHEGDIFMTREYRRVQWHYLRHMPQHALLPLAKYFLSHGRKRHVFLPALDNMPDLLWILQHRIILLHRRYLWLRGTARSDGFKWKVRGLNDSYLSYTGHEEWLKPEILQKGRLFVDVGAHVGRWTLRASKYYDGVVAFEPTDRTRKVLLENLDLNNIHNVIVRKSALGRERSIMTINYFPKLRSNGGNSLLARNPAQHERYASKVIPLQEVQVEPLDDYSLAPDLVKIDTEGYELEVLAAMPETLSHTKRVIAEAHRDEDVAKISKLLKNAGFTIRVIVQPYEVHVVGER